VIPAEITGGRCCAAREAGKKGLTRGPGASERRRATLWWVNGADGWRLTRGPELSARGKDDARVAEAGLRNGEELGRVLGLVRARGKADCREEVGLGWEANLAVGRGRRKLGWAALGLGFWFSFSNSNSISYFYF
jgi:hypothetical protein